MVRAYYSPIGLTLIDSAVVRRVGCDWSTGRLRVIVYNDTEHFGEFARTGFNAGPRQRQLAVKYSRLPDLNR